MVENNYDILGVHEGAAKKEIQEAFRKLALRHHSDRGGDIEKFKRIKQAYEDLKQGKKYPDTDAEKQRKSRVYSGDDKEDVRRRNKILAKELTKEMKLAQEWSAALNRSNATGSRLFGSKTLGEIEFERKANGALSIKGNIMAGDFTYDGHITMQGNITSPSFNEESITSITLKRGDFKFVNPLENRYKIDNGARIIAENGNIVVGNVFGRKDQVQDPDGKVGIYITVEHRTYLYSPRGKIIVENVANTVNLDADSIMILNMEDDVRIKGREILIYGNKITHDVVIELKANGIIRFFDKHSVLGLSDDATIKLDNGKTFRLHDLKVRRIEDLPEKFIQNNETFEKEDTMVGKGFIITYEMLDNFEKKSERRSNSGWGSRLGFGRR